MRRRRSLIPAALLLLVACLAISVWADEDADPSVRTIAVEGRVVDVEGRPVSGVVVEAVRTDPVGWLHGGATRTVFDYHFLEPAALSPPTARTDADGRFRLADLPVARADALYFVRARPESPLRSTAGIVHSAAPATAALELRVLPGRVIRGQLRDEQGAPIRAWMSAYAQARSAVLHGPISADDFHLATDLPTDAEGRFELVAPLDRDVWIRARVPGALYELLGTCVGVTTKEAVIVLPLTGGAEVRGRVQDVEGRPVADARVLVHATSVVSSGFGGLRISAARTDAAGRFHVAGLPATDVQGIAVEAEGYAIWNHNPYQVPLDESRPLVLAITLQRPGRLRVCVRGEDGTPVAGARVTATTGHAMGPALSQGWTGEAIADEEGIAVIANVPPGRGQVWVRSATHYQLPIPHVGRGGLPLGVPYALLEGGETCEVEVAMAPGRTLRGRLVDPRGQPVGGATLSIRLERSDTSPGSGIGFEQHHTDADGAFELRGCPPVTAVHVEVHRSDSARISTRLEWPAGDSSPPVEIVLPDGATVSGHVLDAADEPVPGIAVYAEGTGIPGVTDAQGRFRIRGVAPGRRRLTLGFHPTPGDVAHITVRRGDAVPDVVLRHPGTDTLAGRVVDAQGLPVAGQSVDVSRLDGGHERASMLADAKGRFRFERLVRGRYRIGAGAASAEVETGPDAQADVELRLPAPGTSYLIEGQVLDPVGHPVAVGTVRIAFPADGPHTQRAGTAIVAGRFRARVPGERHDLAVHVSEAADAFGRRLNVLPARVEVPAGQEGPTVVRMQKAEVLRGYVFDEEGRPVAHLQLSITPKPEEGPPRPIYQAPLQVFTDAEGRFELEGLRRIPYLVGQMARGGWVTRPPRVVTPGEGGLELRLERWRTLRVRAVGADGAPLAHCRVHVSPTDPPPARGNWHGGGTTDAEGLFERPMLPPEARLTVRVDPPESEETADLYPVVKTNVDPGEPLAVSFPTSPRVGGRVVDTQGVPIPGARVRMFETRVSGLQGSTPAPLVRLDRQMVADASGAFLWRRIDPSRQVSFQVDGPTDAEPVYFQTRQEAVAPGTTDLVIVLERAVVITGTVPGIQAADLKGLSLRVTPYTPGAPGARFQFDGTTTTFRLSPLRAGPHRLRLGGGQGLKYVRERTVEAPATDLTLAVRRVFRLAGVVLGARGDPFELEMHGPDGKLAGSTADRDGLFRFSQFEDATVSILVRRKDDPRVALLTDVRLSRGEPLVIELAPGSRIAGRVVDLPVTVRGATVHACRGSIRIPGTVAVNGDFSTPALPPGSYRLEFAFRFPPGGSVPAPEAVEAGTEDLVLEWAGVSRR